MALRKSIALRNGYDADFWKIARIDIQRGFVDGGGKVKVIICAWKDQTSFDAGLDMAGATITKIYSGQDVSDDIDANRVNLRWVYLKLKNETEFLNAQDVIPDAV